MLISSVAGKHPERMSLSSSCSLWRREEHRHAGRTMRKLKLLGVAFALAAGAFVLTIVKDPPKLVASDPSAATVQPADVHVHLGLPFGDCLSAGACP